MKHAAHPKPPRRENDSSYRNLFNHADMIEHLLRRYAGDRWIRRLDFSTLEPVKASFVGRENQSRESDIIWRLKLRDSGTWFYVYTLIEFQSTPDKFMALRLLTYLCLLYENLLRHKELTENDKLPPALPIVLYNGARPWNSPTEVADLIQPVEGLSRHIPKFRYLVLDEGHMSEEQLGPLDNPVTAIFRIEQAKTIEDLRTIIPQLVRMLAGKEAKEQRKDVISWLRRVIFPVNFPGSSRGELRELLENEDMIAERIQEWHHQWFDQGRQEGLVEIVLRLLELKFDPATAAAYRGVVSGADPETLSGYAESILSANAPSDVFGDSSLS